MKKDKIYITIILILIIVLIGLLVFSANNLNTSKKTITCTKELTLSNNTYENKYVINVGNKMEIVSIKMINNYKNISDTKKEEIKKQLDTYKTNKQNAYACIDKDKFICTIETNEILDSDGNKKDYWYYTYINNLKEQGYTCSE